jgi:hypothetical protein
MTSEKTKNDIITVMVLRPRGHCVGRDVELIDGSTCEDASGRPGCVMDYTLETTTNRSTPRPQSKYWKVYSILSQLPTPEVVCQRTPALSEQPGRSITVVRVQRPWLEGHLTVVPAHCPTRRHPMSRAALWSACTFSILQAPETANITVTTHYLENPGEPRRWSGMPHFFQIVPLLPSHGDFHGYV